MAQVALDPASHINAGDTGFMFLCTALVQLMTPGLACFYGGLAASTGVITLMFQSFVSLGIIFLLWTTVAFSLSYGEPLVSVAGYNIIGDPTTYWMLENVGIWEPIFRGGKALAPNIPGLIYVAYQGMFAVITPALISGAFVARIHIKPYIAFTMIWLLLVYAPLAYWNWGGGWMAQIGAWDFAGGIVVHESAGFSALAGLIFLGNRKAPREGDPFPKTPHNMTLVSLGTAMLWIGWFAFNGGSALGSNCLAMLAFMNTQIAASSGMCTWVAIDGIRKGKLKLLGACSGAICGMVVITPLAGFVQPSKAILAGILGSLVSERAVHLIDSCGLDDAVDTVGIHGVGGWLGSVLVGILADPSTCANTETAPHWCANPGTVTRSWKQIQIQTFCATVSSAYAFVVTYLILTAMWQLKILPILKTFAEQETARDLLQHGEIAYARMPWQQNEWAKCLEQCLLNLESNDTNCGSSPLKEAFEIQDSEHSAENSCSQADSDDEKTGWFPRELTMSSNTASLILTPRDGFLRDVQTSAKAFGFGTGLPGFKPL